MEVINVAYLQYGICNLKLRKKINIDDHFSILKELGLNIDL